MSFTPPDSREYPINDAVRAALEVTRRGCVELLVEADWCRKLARSQATGVPLRIKLGLDPTRPDIHLGHTVVLNKLRQLQDLGHQVIFLIGDFTSLIGDPSGRNTTRPMLTEAEIQTNAQTYYDQAARILNPERTEVCYNSTWCKPLGATGMIGLAAKYTLARMLERDDFTLRYKAGNPISLHELLYPLVQGYDSVALRSDLELGGTDQKFNLLVGRELQKEYGQEPQCVLTMPLLVGLDGVEKMSKSKNNYIGVTEPANTMFAKLMSISDELMWNYFELLSFRSTTDIAALKQSIAAGANPRHAKVALAKELVARFHDVTAAEQAEADFDLRAKGGVPENIPEVSLQGAPLGVGAVLKMAGLVPSTSEAMRLIEQGGVRVEGGTVSDKALKLPQGSYVVQVGKRKFARIILS